jgi:hypothetical protein
VDKYVFPDGNMLERSNTPISSSRKNNHQGGKLKLTSIGSNHRLNIYASFVRQAVPQSVSISDVAYSGVFMGATLKSVTTQSRNISPSVYANYTLWLPKEQAIDITGSFSYGHNRLCISYTELTENIMSAGNVRQLTSRGKIDRVLLLPHSRDKAAVTLFLVPFPLYLQPAGVLWQAVRPPVPDAGQCRCRIAPKFAQLYLRFALPYAVRVRPLYAQAKGAHYRRVVRIFLLLVCGQVAAVVQNVVAVKDYDLAVFLYRFHKGLAFRLFLFVGIAFVNLRAVFHGQTVHGKKRRRTVAATAHAVYLSAGS